MRQIVRNYYGATREARTAANDRHSHTHLPVLRGGDREERQRLQRHHAAHCYLHKALDSGLFELKLTLDLELLALGEVLPQVLRGVMAIGWWVANTGRACMEPNGRSRGIPWLTLHVK